MEKLRDDPSNLIVCENWIYIYIYTYRARKKNLLFILIVKSSLKKETTFYYRNPIYFFVHVRLKLRTELNIEQVRDYMWQRVQSKPLFSSDKINLRLVQTCNTNILQRVYCYFILGRQRDRGKQFNVSTMSRYEFASDEKGNSERTCIPKEIAILF